MNSFLLQYYFKTILSHSIILLQEIGLNFEFILNSTNFRNSSHHFFSNTSVGILIGSQWNILKIYKNTIGTILSVIISNNNVYLCIISVYLPSALDFIEINTKQIEKKKRITEAVKTYSDLLEHINQLPSNINWIIGGDINETRKIYDRVYPRTFSYLPNKERFIDLFLNNVDGIDVWRGLHRTLPGHTRFKDEKSSSRLDYWIISKKWWKTIKKYVDFRIHHVNDSGSDHRAIVLSFPILLQPHLPNVPFRIIKPKLPKME